MTVELYLLRHADAGDPAAWEGPDEARPLSRKGRRQAERLGEFLAGVRFAPSALISSPMLRARETAELVGAALDRPVRIDDRLARGVDPETVARVLADAGDPTRPILVGHDPDFSELVALLTGTEAIPRRVIRKPVGAPQPVIQKKVIKRPLSEGEGESTEGQSSGDDQTEDEL